MSPKAVPELLGNKLVASLKQAGRFLLSNKAPNKIRPLHPYILTFSKIECGYYSISNFIYIIIYIKYNNII